MSDRPHTPTAAKPAQSLRERAIALALRPEIIGMASVILVKVMMVTLNFTLIALAARTLDNAAFGNYSILFSAAGLLLIVAAAGQELFVIRGWNEYATTGSAAWTKGLLGFSAAICLAASAVAAIAFYPWLAYTYGHAIALPVIAFLVLSAGLQITNHLVRTAVGVAAGDGVGNLLQLSPVIAYLAVSLIGGQEVSLVAIFAFLALGSATGLVTHLAMLARLVKRLFPDFSRTRARAERSVWFWRSLRLWGANTLEATNQHVDVLIIGFLMSPTVAGAYFVTVRFANLFAAAADSINLFATRHFAGLYYRNEEKKLAALLDSVAWITLAFIGLGLVGIAAGGYFALYLINPDYAAYYPELLVLCLGTAALAMARPCGSVLMLTGFEGKYLRIIGASVTLRVVLLFLLIPQFGVMGAVSATALSFVIAAIAMRNSAKHFTRLDVSVARLLAKRQIATA